MLSLTALDARKNAGQLINYLSFFVKGAAMLCLLLQRRLAKLDENGEQGKGKELSSQFIFLISERTDR